MSIQSGIYRLYARYKIGSSGVWGYTDSVLVYVNTVTGLPFTTQKNLITNNEPNSAEISEVEAATNFSSVPITLDNVFNYGTVNWASYSSKRQLLLETASSLVDVDISLPETYITDNITQSKRVYVQYSFDSNFSTIVLEGNFYNSGASGTIISRAYNGGTSSSGDLKLIHLHFWYDTVTDKLYTVQFDYTEKLSTTSGGTTTLFVLPSTTSSMDSSSLIYQGFSNAEPYHPITPTGDDPYDPSGDGSGYSGTGGGPAPTGGTGTTGNGGLHDDTSDNISTPSLPSNISTGSGLFTAYNPSASQLASFGAALWSMDISDIDDVLRFLVGGDAFNAIIGLHLLPVQPTTGGSSNIKLGKWDSEVAAPKITNQYAQVNFGSVLLPEYWGNSIDYSPYTKVQLALPYIGIVDVDTDDVLGSTNTLTYNIDVLSGAICATLHCVKGNLNSIIYQWSGSCAVSLPVTGANYNGILGSVLAIAAGAATIAVGGATIAGASGASAALASVKGGAAIAGGASTLAGSALNTFGSVKGKVQKSGSFGANSGALGIMTPYFIVTRPVQSVPTSWQADKGYPANISAQLGTLTGYTEVSEINLECSGTEAEKEEIIRLLKSGVIF